MLAFVADRFGGMDGGSQTARDILFSLLANQLPLVVLSTKACHVPERLHGVSLSTPPWIRVPEFAPLMDRDGFRLNRRWLRKNLRGVRQRLADHRQARFIHKEMRRVRPALVLQNAFPLNPFVHANLSRWGKSAIIVHSSPGCLEEGNRYDQKYTLEWAVQTMARFDAFVFVSARSRDEWLSLPQLSGKQAHFVPNCCREDEVNAVAALDRNEVRRRLGIPPDRFFAICVASLQPRKGQHILVDALRDLTSVAPELLVYFVGPEANRTYAEKLEQQVETQGLEGQVRFLGGRHDVLDLVFAADVLVLPSRSEALPLTILEAMALGTPVIASNVAGNPELIVDGESGLLFPMDDPRALTDAFSRLYRDPALREKLASAARVRYWAHFSRAHHIRRYGEVASHLASM